MFQTDDFCEIQDPTSFKAVSIDASGHKRETTLSFDYKGITIVPDSFPWTQIVSWTHTNATFSFDFKLSDGTLKTASVLLSNPSRVLPVIDNIISDIMSTNSNAVKQPVTPVRPDSFSSTKLLDIPSPNPLHKAVKFDSDDFFNQPMSSPLAGPLTPPQKMKAASRSRLR
ncbi:hypothetical protein RCL1_000293 [Eukaryota sp. TZLM3-RCL]